MVLDIVLAVFAIKLLEAGAYTLAHHFDPDFDDRHTGLRKRVLDFLWWLA